MSLDRTQSEAAAAAASEDRVTPAAARALRVEPESLAVTRLAGDASSRAFYRAEHDGGSVVVVRYPRAFSVDEGSLERLERWCERHPEDGLLTFSNDPVCHVELTALFARHEVPVPAVVAVDDREGLIIVEDAGDDLLQSWSHTATPEANEAAYERAVDLLACVRAATAEAAASNTVAGHLAFDAAKLGWELDFFLVNCFERYLDAPLEPELDEAVRADCGALADALAARPRVLCHRDYHARNLIVRPGAAPAEGLVVIDFQDARMGPLTYDLVSLLEDPYASLDPGLRGRMVARFTDRLVAEGAFPGEAELREEYDLMCVQRLLKAVGTYTNQAAVRGKRDYVPYIAPAVAEAQAALDRLARFPALRLATERIS